MLLSCLSLYIHTNEKSNVTLKCHGGPVTWWDGAGPGGAKQCVVYKPPHVYPMNSVLLVKILI